MDTRIKNAPLSQLIATVELGVAVFLVLGSNLLGIIPFSETPFIFCLALFSFWLHKRGWNSIGLCRPVTWKKTILIALTVAISLQLFSIYVTEPLLIKITGKPANLERFDELNGNEELLLIYFGLIWTLAAFGEEIAYRGFIVNKVAEILGAKEYSWVAGVIFCSVLFGIGHYYQGLTGMIDSGISGLVFGSLYLLSNRNLWVCILAHGFTDTFGLFYFYFGYN